MNNRDLIIKPRIYTDFHSLDMEDRVPLTLVGSLEDLEVTNTILYEDLELTLTDEELEVDGIVTWNDIDQRWMAKINPEEIRNVGDNN